jgi:hypothetical protein
MCLEPNWEVSRKPRAIQSVRYLGAFKERSKPVGRFVQIWDVLSRGLLHELLQQTHDVYVSGDCSGSIDQLRGVRVSLTVVLIVTANPVESLASLVATLWN